uniref:DUF4005 domain-containing protein n=1 Tax=Setaria digitata TaxID=48799 RepID=A0A915PM16_9BILA
MAEGTANICIDFQAKAEDGGCRLLRLVRLPPTGFKWSGDRLRRNRWRGQTSRKDQSSTVSVSNKKERNRRLERRSRLDDPEAPNGRYSHPDLQEYERQQQFEETSAPSYQQTFGRRKPRQQEEIYSTGWATEEIRQNRSKPIPLQQHTTFNKQKLEKLSQRQRNSIFAIARAKLNSFVSRLSISGGTGCAATRILTSTSSISTADNDRSSVISFPLRQESQNATQTDPQSVVVSALSSSIRANTSLPNSTVHSDLGTSESCCSAGSISVQNELQLAKSPAATTAFLYHCNASSNPNNADEHQHHLQKQKPTTFSASFQQISYPAAVYLTDGENSYFGKV